MFPTGETYIQQSGYGNDLPDIVAADHQEAPDGAIYRRSPVVCVGIIVGVGQSGMLDQVFKVTVRPSTPCLYRKGSGQIRVRCRLYIRHIRQYMFQLWGRYPEEGVLVRSFSSIDQLGNIIISTWKGSRLRRGQCDYKRRENLNTDDGTDVL